MEQRAGLRLFSLPAALVAVSPTFFKQNSTDTRAALAGMSLSDYLLSEIRAVAERPTIEELRERLQQRASVAPSLAPADAVRAERDRA